MRCKKNGVPFVEMAGDRPYKLWSSDLMECQDCGALVLWTAPRQMPISESYQEDFTAKLTAWAPQHRAREWTR